MFYFRVKATQVDLPSDFNCELVIENPLFIQDRIPVAYTTSAAFPLTPSNKRLMDEPDRVNKIKGDRVWEYDGAIMGYGARVLYYGMLQIMEIGGQLKWNFQASDELSTIKKNMNDLDWGTINFGSGDYSMRTDPDFGLVPPFYIGDIPMITYKNHWASARDNGLLYTNGPIKTSDTGFPTKFDEDLLVYVNALYGQNQWFNPWANTSGFISGVIYNPLTTTIERYAHSPMYPQLRAYQVLKKLLNLADVDNPFYSEELYRVVLTSHFHPNLRDDLVQKWSGIILDNDYPSNLTPAENLILDIASYQPAMPANDILKALLNITCGTLFRYQENGQGVFRIKLNKDIINDPTFQDWDSLLGSKLILTREQAQDYIYGYDDFRESAPAIDPEFVLTDVASIIDAPVNVETGEQVYYIQTTGQLILKRLAAKVEDTDPDEFVFEVKNSGMGFSESEDGYQITSVLSPMKMRPELGVDSFFNQQSKPARRLYLPIYEGEKSVKYKPHLMMYYGNITNQLNPPFLAPYLSYHNYDAGGNRLGELSLQWEGQDGLLNTYHKYFKEWMESDRLGAYGDFIFSPYFLKDVDLAKKILVRSKLWWIKKIIVPFSKKKIEPAKVDLVEAPPVPAEVVESSVDPESSDPGSSYEETGICYEFRLDTLVFNPEVDDFNVYFQRPGESLISQNYNDFDQFDDGTDTVFYLCSESAVALIQDGMAVASVNGLTITSGGSCTVDAQCAL
tara:strand:+ start:31983 stop:34184 length:2202 start_codon:yes stop_codon:yes gene_type:complete